MSKRISQLTQLTAAQLASNDILAIVDVSAGQTKYITVKDLTGLPDFGWTATGESWAYSSWDSTTRIGVITVPTDATVKYTPKNRVRFSQTTGGTKYGIIHKVTATTLTVHFPSGTTLTNETITSPVYSGEDSPVGFPTDVASWLLTYTNTSTTAATGSVGVWQNPNTSRIALGIGSWRVMASLAFQASGNLELLTGLGSSASGGIYVNGDVIRDYQTSRANPWLNSHRHVLNNVTLAAAGFVYALFQSAGNFDNRGDASSPHQTYMEAVTNYL